MMRNLLGMAALLCLMTLQIPAADDKKPDDKSDKDKLQGTWLVTGLEIMGKIESLKDIAWVFTFNDGKVTITIDKKPEEGTYKLDEKKNPKEIDMTTPKKGNPKEMETAKGIYKVDGDTLKICIPDNGPLDPRPAAFDKGGIGIVLARKK